MATSVGIVAGAEAEHLRGGVGRLIRQARTAAGMSQSRMAALCAVARSTVQRIEHGQRRPRRDLLRLLAIVLDRENPDRLEHQLVHAAGESARPASAGTRRQREIAFVEQHGITRTEAREARDAWQARRKLRYIGWHAWFAALASTDVADLAALHGIDYPRGVDLRTPITTGRIDHERLLGRLSVCFDPPHWR